MRVTIETSTSFETFDVPEGCGVGLKMVSLPMSDIAIEVVSKAADGDVTLGQCLVATGSLDEFDDIDDLISKAVEEPRYGGCGLRSIRLGDLVLYDWRGDRLPATCAVGQ
ncbi:hypothetical protein E5335_07420 [Coriobacteriaceae bacterium]|uniref:Uncharacterized protein n=1 Tax=Granulimonas faecalis TaxID=2894155 RepID=A0AAV5B3Q0_9ACTN|nr:hypothetical protein [Granulimonas faecalis]TGY58715.1 hypothetical protein E5335_07420 [Coriobacteriaceae bacterium]GJM56181.1 hypothetical protein ATOP_18360 [Granulimonas faecalis]